MDKTGRKRRYGMGSAKQRISGALILTLGASMLVGCNCREKYTGEKYQDRRDTL